MVVTVVLAAAIGGFVIWNIRTMIRNVRQGKSIDGCDGNCSHCSQCPHSH